VIELDEDGHPTHPVAARPDGRPIPVIIMPRCDEIKADNEKDSIGSAPAEEWRGATDGGAGALRIEFIERSRNQSLGIEWFFAADGAEWST
jgi:hypothetical protein